MNSRNNLFSKFFPASQDNLVSISISNCDINQDGFLVPNLADSQLIQRFKEIIPSNFNPTRINKANEEDYWDSDRVSFTRHLREMEIVNLGRLRWFEWDLNSLQKRLVQINRSKTRYEHDPYTEEIFTKEVQKNENQYNDEVLAFSIKQCSWRRYFYHQSFNPSYSTYLCFEFSKGNKIPANCGKTINSKATSLLCNILKFHASTSLFV